MDLFKILRELRQVIQFAVDMRNVLLSLYDYTFQFFSILPIIYQQLYVSEEIKIMKHIKYGITAHAT